jgi:hypothetical protein
MNSKANRLFLYLGGFFIANALIAEFIGVKIFALEDSLGWEKMEFNFFGIATSFDLTAGVILWPIVFVMTDIINEYFGKKGVRLLSYFAVILISYAFVMVYLAIAAVPASWWPAVNQSRGMEDMELAFELVFGQGLWIIVASLVAFLISQLIDVIVFQRLKRLTGEKAIWLRATGSTLVSQLIDSFVVLFIAFKIGGGWSTEQVLAIGFTNYIYKFSMAIILTPALYGAHFVIDRYLGEDLANQLKQTASEGS